jgi:carbohydrate-selective porin OprB
MTKKSNVVRRLLIVFVLQAIVTGQSMAQSADKTPQAVDNNPRSPANVLEGIVPQPGSLIPYGVPHSWFDFKDDVYDKIGLKFGFSYQLLAQSASDTLPNSKFDTAMGDWWGFMTRWSLLNKGSENEGTFVFSMFERGVVGNNASPAGFGLVNVGSLTSNVEFSSWDFEIENLFWEQYITSEKTKVQFRIGNQVAMAFLNPSRFKDSRVSYTTGPWAFHPTIPYPTFGFGAAAKWWPDKESGFYIAGSLNDMNGDPNAQGFDWSTVDRGEFFYGLEFGKNIQRAKDDYDHWHLLVFYADERSTRSPDTLPNKAGGGFRLYGEKQWDRWVGHAGYTYNTAQGGGIAGTLSEHTLTAGVAYLNPFNIRGEAAISLLYMNPIEEIFSNPVRDEYGIETYWRISLSNNAWITPGIRLVFNPSLNQEDDFIAIPQIKFRIAL